MPLLDLDKINAGHHGKGGKDRRVRFGPKTARAVSGYLRARTKHKAAHLPDLGLTERGIRPLARTFATCMRTVPDVTAAMVASPWLLLSLAGTSPQVKRNGHRLTSLSGAL